MHPLLGVTLSAQLGTTLSHFGGTTPSPSTCTSALDTSQCLAHAMWRISKRLSTSLAPHISFDRAEGSGTESTQSCELSAGGKVYSPQRHRPQRWTVHGPLSHPCPRLGYPPLTRSHRLHQPISSLQVSLQGFLLSSLLFVARVAGGEVAAKPY